MITNFDRCRTQVFIENKIGCSGSHDLKSFSDKFSQYKISHVDLTELKDLNLRDGRDLFYKGMLSLSEAISDLHHGLSSWAVVKIYYATFFFIRSSLCMQNYCIIRTHQNPHSLDLRVGESIQKIKQGRIHGDHKLTFVAWRKLIGESKDILLTNKVDGTETYVWLMEAREATQYKHITFKEPKCLNFLSPIFEGSLESLIDTYLEDIVPIYCFDADHACLAIPLQRAMLTYKHVLDNKLMLNPDEKMVISSILDPYLSKNCMLRSMF